MNPASPTPSSGTRPRLLVLAYDIVGPRMAGPGIRSWEIARALTAHADVTIAFDEPIERSAEDVETAAFFTEAELEQLVQRHDAVLIQGLALRKHPVLAQTDVTLIVDLYDPWLFENIQIHRRASSADATRALVREADVQNELIDAGDAFICASERQRDYWLGMLTSRGRIDLAAWESDDELRQLIDVVPYGCPSSPPAGGQPHLKGVHPSVSDSDTLILWSGGVWEWFDPMLAVEALAIALKRAPQLRLYFMGMTLEGRTAKMPIADRIRARADELGLLDTHIIFGDWVPYDERGRVLQEADAAVLAAHPSAETRLSFRSRVLDHFWAGLPTITTPGDVLAEEIAAEGAGLLVPHGDVDAMADALVRVALEPDFASSASAAAQSLAERYTWEQNTSPLARLLQNLDAVRAYRTRRAAHFAEAAIPLAHRGALPALHDQLRPAPIRLPLKARLRLSPLGPALRRLRRTRLGRRIWGDLPAGI